MTNKAVGEANYLIDERFLVFSFEGVSRFWETVYRGIVQSVERWSPKPNVEGSSPSAPVIFFKPFLYDEVICIWLSSSVG